MPQENESQKKLKELEERIHNAKSDSSDSDSSESRDITSYAGVSAIRVILEITAGLAVGMGLGFATDKVLDTQPIFFIIFTLLGVAGATLNIYKLADDSMGESEDSSNEG